MYIIDLSHLYPPWNLSASLPISSLKTLSTSPLQSKCFFFSQEDPKELRLFEEPYGVLRQLEDPPCVLLSSIIVALYKQLSELGGISEIHIPQSYLLEWEEKDNVELDLVNDGTEFLELDFEQPTSKQ